MSDLNKCFERQQFSNGYELANGVRLHAENGVRFQIPPNVIKRHLGVGHFVELRIDSPRFSVHAEDAVNCSCPSCDGELSKPILRHEHPHSLRPTPQGDIPSRGWGEDFWVKITDRTGDHFEAEVDNDLIEARRHGLSLGDTIYFHVDNVLAEHPIQRGELVSHMDATDLKELAVWVGQMKQ